MLFRSDEKSGAEQLADRCPDGAGKEAVAHGGDEDPDDERPQSGVRIV